MHYANLATEGVEVMLSGITSEHIKEFFGHVSKKMVKYGGKRKIWELDYIPFRKGAATFLSTIAGGPTAISVNLRTGWSLGL